MMPFTYERADSVASASAAANRPGARFIAGGTNLLDLMKVDVEQPHHLVDVSRLPLHDIDEPNDGGLRIGALVSNAALAADPRVRQHYPMLAQALLNGASPQLRNQATTAGNLLQRTRCPYFYDVARPCNKRSPGTGCSALQGYNRMHAILGANDGCIAVHPSDMAVAMTALGANVEVHAPSGKPHTLAITELLRLPGSAPEQDTALASGELITAVTLPPPPHGRQLYRKIRDRASYAFALVSVAATLDVVGGRIRDARVAMGGVAHKPWQPHGAIAALIDSPASEQAFDDAGVAAVAGARSYTHNAFKVELARRAVTRTLGDLANTGG